MKQITITHDRVVCSCGFEDKSLDLQQLARIHNSRDHMGNYRIYDQNEEATIRQVDGKVMR